MHRAYPAQMIVDSMSFPCIFNTETYLCDPPEYIILANTQYSNFYPMENSVEQAQPNSFRSVFRVKKLNYLRMKQLHLLQQRDRKRDALLNTFYPQLNHSGELQPQRERHSDKENSRKGTQVKSGSHRPGLDTGSFRAIKEKVARDFKYIEMINKITINIQ